MGEVNLVRILAKISESQISGRIAFYNVALSFEVDNKKNEDQGI